MVDGVRVFMNPVLDNSVQQKLLDVLVVELGVDELHNIHDSHARAVLDTLMAYGTPSFGVQLSGLNFNDSYGDGAGTLSFSLDISTLKALDQYIDAVSCNVLNAVSNKIEALLKSSPMKTRVLNLSVGKSRAEIYHDVLCLLVNSQKLHRQFIRVTELSKGTNYEDPGYRQAIVTYVEDRLHIKKILHAQALSRYQRVTQQAAQTGLTIVVAADNDHLLAQFYGVAGSDFNFLAQSAAVISVAAVDRVGQVWEGSSRGNGRFAPTLAAYGVDIDTSVGSWTGTSFATPQVSAAVAQMLVEDPDLTFTQIKTILQQTAVPLMEPELAVGAGMLNAELAVAQAQQRGDLAILEFAYPLAIPA